MRTFFRNTASVQRLVASNGKSAYQSHGSVQGFVMGLQADETFLVEGVNAQSAVFCCEAGSDVQKGDIITVNAVEYVVKAEKEPDRLFGISFKKCIVEKMVN